MSGINNYNTKVTGRLLTDDWLVVNMTSEEEMKMDRFYFVEIKIGKVLLHWSIPIR